MKILVVGPSWVGDMIMAQTLFKAIKLQNNNAIIDVLAPAWSSPIIPRIPEANELIDMPVGHGKIGLGVRYKLAMEIKKRKYDQAIILPNSLKSSLVPFFAKIPIRTGWLGEMRFGFLNDIRYLNKKKYPKMVDRFVALAYPKGTPQSSYKILNPKLTPDKNNLNSVANKFLLKFDKKILAICPGAAFGAAKRWTSKHFANVINQKVNSGWDIWIFGSAQDAVGIEDILKYVESKLDIKNFAGKINLLETIDLFSKVDAFVCNDSGLMHIAASLDKPVVAVYGPTSPEFTPPLTNKAIILQKDLDCNPCFKRECPLFHHNCMEQLQPSLVIDALGKIS